MALIKDMSKHLPLLLWVMAVDHVHTPTNVPTKVTLARSKVKSRSHYDVVYLHTQPMSLQSINFVNLIVSEI